MKAALLFFISGLLALLFGIFVILEPTMVVNIVALAFSIILAIKGCKTLFDCLTLKKNALKVVVNGSPIDLGIQKRIRMTFFCDGLISFLVGLGAFIIAVSSFKNNSDGIMKAVVYIVAIGFFFTGIANYVESRRLKPYPILSDSYRSSFWVYIIASILLFAFPFFIGNAVMNIFGILLIVAGVSLFVWGWRVASLSRNI